MKLLFLDIETSPNLAYVWGLFNQNISIGHIAEPGRTLCWAAKWENKKQIIFSSIKDGEKEMAKKMWDLLNEADAVCHYNGKKFDMPTLNREFLLFEMMPPTNYKQIDLYHTVRRQFRFVSNKLDFVCQQLGLGAKVHNKGMALWTGCMSGDPQSWREMERYNRQDVRLLPLLYEKLLPWIQNHPNRGLYGPSDHPTCKNCGSYDVKKNGREMSTRLTYQRYKCNNCGTNLKGRKSLENAPAGLLV